ncbi:MAG: tetratricopeptide repeat protein [Planctomycetota bacterium]
MKILEDDFGIIKFLSTTHASFVYPQDRPDLAGIYCNLGICLKQQGQIDEAIEAFNKALAIDPRQKRASEALRKLSHE